MLMEDRYMSSILKQVRLNLNLTQKEASSYLGIPLRTFQNWEEGARVPAEWTIDLVVDELLNYYKEQEIKDKGGVYSLTMIKKKLGGVVNKYDISKIILFGSYAKGCAKPTSDIDLVVTTSLKGLAFYGLAQDLEELFNREIDLIRDTSIIKDSKVDLEIRKTGIVIYERQKFNKNS